MELRSGLRLLRERWKLILVAVVLATAAGGYLTWQETPQYASEVTLFISAGGPEDTAAAYQGSLLSQQKVKSYTELVRGEHVMAGVVERLNLDLTPKQLSAQVTSSAIPDTSLLTASVRDPSPQVARRIARTIGREFVDLVPTLESVAPGQPPPVKVTVVSPAELPTSPVSPRPVRNLVLSAVLGILAGFGLAFARRALDTTTKTPAQVEELSGAPSLGTVVFDPTATKRPLIGLATHGPRAEALRKVRTNLQFVDIDREHRSILVTSAVPQEGKSMTASNLAITLAEAEKRIILLDADLRRPSVAGYMGLPNGVGLTDVLLGRVNLDDATQQGGSQLLSVLTSGPVPPNPTALLGSQRLRELLDQLRSRYDLVIVDSPPVLPVADAAVLGAVCDGALVVVRHGKTQHEQLRETVRALRNTGTPILGTVINQAPAQRRSYYAYDYTPTGDRRRQRKQRRQGEQVPAGLVGAGKS